LGVDIHVQNECAFIMSCARGQIDIAKWLYSLEIDIHSNTYDPRNATSCGLLIGTNHIIIHDKIWKKLKY